MLDLVEDIFQQGVQFHKSGKVEIACQLYSAVLKVHPEHPTANHSMGVLAVEVGKVQEALVFFEAALEANPATAQFWLSYIDALIKLEKLADAKAVLDQAKSKGAKGDGFDTLETRLNERYEEPLEASKIASEPTPKKPNILDSLKMDQAISLAKKKAKDGSPEEAKRIYQDILTKFPKNKRASDGMKRLAGKTVGEASKVQDPPQDQLQSLVNLYSQGQLQLALKQAETLVQQFPQSPVLFNIQGAVLKGLGQLDLSIQAYKKAITVQPDYADAYNNMGVALQDQGKLEETIEAYNKALAIKPDNAEAYNNMGVTLREQGKLEEAIEAYNKALAIKPDYAEAYNNMGNALKDQGKLEEAIEAYNKVLAIKPDYAEAYNNMGVTLQEQGKLEEAIEACNKALAIKPDYAEAHSNMGITLQDQGKLEEAIEAYNKALAIKPDYAKAYNNMGNALREQGKLEEAIEAYNKALAIKPDYAEAHQNLSYAFLNANRLSEGLVEYDWRWKTKERSKTQRHFAQPLWDGKTSLKGKRILIWSEQGVGDTINWSSRLPLVSAQADHCILECPEKLVPLMDRSFPNIEVKPEDRNNDEHRTDFDYHLPLGSLYCRFAREILNDTKPNAFLLPDPIRVEYWTKRLRSLGEGPYLGVSWKSANMSPKRLPNYAPLADWSPIFTSPGMTFINLQYTDSTDDLIEIQNKFGVTVHNFDDLNHFDDLDDVAALCAALDIVVSTKITVPLISAGVGTATKLANWRQSPWNNTLFNPVGPSINIFERNTWEPWGSVFQLIAKDIKKE
ncbi:tetratricopeptide repeat protein [Planktomarina temperata]|nr:tetratricopeptide repeat protein [Planktomarina temperata]